MKFLYRINFAAILQLFAVILIFSISGCRKDITVDSNLHKTMEELKVTSSFSWETSHEVNLTVAVDIPDGIGSLVKIIVYDGNPIGTGNALLTGSAGYNFPFAATLRIPTALKQLYLEMKTNSGVTQVVAVNVADNIQYTFKQTKSGTKDVLNVTEPDCNSGCNTTLSGSGTTSMTGGKIYCVTGTYNGTVTSGSGGGTLKVCGGKATLSLLKVNTAGCNIIVTSGGTLVIDSLYMSSTSTFTVYQSSHASVRGLSVAINSKIINYSDDFLFSAPFSFNGEIQNYGKMILKGDATLGGTGGKLTNSGNFTAQGWLKVNVPLTNDGVIEVSNYLHLNKPDGTTGSVVNNCRIIGHANVHVFGATFLMNNGYLKCDQEVHLFQYSSTVTLQNQSMISTQSFVMERNILGTGGTSSIKVTGTASLNDASKKVDGPIELATSNGTFTGAGTSNLVNGASLTAIAQPKNYIAVTACNPEGIGQPAPPDNDGDGVADNLDEFPNDVTRAYSNYYPAKGQFGSLAFEDLWPGRGDYDMNDLVVDYNYRIITNGQNKVVDIYPKFYVRAVGATLQNGFGFQFDNVSPADVASVTGSSLKMSYINLSANGTENQQDKAVVIVFDNTANVIHPVGSGFFNTSKDQGYGISDSIFMEIHFTTPQEASATGTPPYNPFLIKNQSRGVEIHLPDRKPTSLADVSLFGTYDDDSKPETSRYYKTTGNLPWVINIPVKYDYTWENVPVITGYLKFGTWAESSGVSWPDWYKDLSGYRDATQIYMKKVK